MSQIPPLPNPSPNPTWMVWTGRVISVLSALMLFMSAATKFMKPNDNITKNLEHIGWKAGQMPTLGIIELVCAVHYVIPQTSVLGAVLLTGYLGGATATHVRVGDDTWFAPVMIGGFVWLGLFLRDSRLRTLIPWRFL